METRLPWQTLKGLLGFSDALDVHLYFLGDIPFLMEGARVLPFGRNRAEKRRNLSRLIHASRGLPRLSVEAAIAEHGDAWVQGVLAKSINDATPAPKKMRPHVVLRAAHLARDDAKRMKRLLGRAMAHAQAAQ